ncbi:MAG TPA: acyl transferase [Bacteroidia bacterium]|nr:acyl transferase [Bacteroidia bacterium]
MSFPVDKIFSIQSEKDFTDAALAVFHYQVQHCKVYSEYVKLREVKTDNIKQVRDIPLLPIEFFKSHKVLSDEKTEEVIFHSSGTTGNSVSKHFVADAGLYIRSFEKCFKIFYGSIEDYCFLALLPSYLERENSSLVFMANHLIKKSRYPLSSFYPDDHEKLFLTLKKLMTEEKKVILFGVSYALLGFAEKFPLSLRNVTVMETGGMKGRREELTRGELHQQLCNAFQLSSVHSEYGMTELLSQAYSKGNGIFHSPPWMKIMLRNPDDPFDVSEKNLQGIVNVIDLANIYSCSFIATQDFGRVAGGNSFEISGRTDYSDVRGCNLMISDI